MKKLRNIAIIILVIAVLAIVGGLSYYNYNLSPVGKSKETVAVEIPAGTSKKGVAKILKSKKLIRDENCFMIYLKIYKDINIKAGFYDFNQSMNVKEITEKLNEGSKKNPNEIQITFKEGINIREIAQIISSNTSNKYDDIINKTKDTAYLDQLINKYWFITDDIKNEALYYGLEGYLFPNTYRFENKDVSIETIFEKMLNEMNNVLTPYKEKIENSSLSIHETLTLATITEMESTNRKTIAENEYNDRQLVASVMLNRIAKKMTLGSDVTTRYALKIDNKKQALTKAQFQTVSPYNTRLENGSMNGKLPVGPICSPSKESIEAAINPAESDYLFFIANIKTLETFYFKTYGEFLTKKNELQAVNQGL